MKNILEEFAYGNINPSVGSIKKGSYYERIVGEVNDRENKLLSSLEGEQREVFIKYTGKQSEAIHIAETDKFILGYRLGVLMTMEVFKGREDSIFGAEVGK